MKSDEKELKNQNDKLEVEHSRIEKQKRDYGERKKGSMGGGRLARDQHRLRLLLP